MRGDTEPDNLKTAYACPHCTDYFDTEKEFEDHYKKNHCLYTVQMSLIRKCLVKYRSLSGRMLWKAITQQTKSGSIFVYNISPHGFFEMPKSNSYKRLLMEASSGGLEEDIDHTLGDLLELLENLAAILSTYRSKYLDNNTLKTKSIWYSVH
ncbi:hypothetical protein BDB01DRAFT_836578 [Pilobolus umbonatus]|nr:hypothetical protein BDB01DRAFT_836578 [Pilobolus umbonatus]